jgi:hypothetical protein
VQNERPDPYPSCDVCGRTLLKGEQVHDYLTPQRSKQVVCVHCRSRAEASGWIPRAMAETLGTEPPSRARRGQALRQRIGRATSRARTSARGARSATAQKADTPTGEEPDAPEARRAAAKQSGEKPAREKPRTPHGERPKRRAPKQAKPRPKREPATRAGERKPRPRRGPDALMRRAVERFNRSEEPRKVAGLIRSLGKPHAGVRADPGRQLALVTVAWELSWYQWEVNAEGDGEPVREVAKGKEMSELAEDARAWNAAAAEDGTLRLRSAARRKPAAKKA